MSALTLDGNVGEVLVDVEERGARYVALEVELAAAPGTAELPAAVDELVAQSVESTFGNVEPSGRLRRPPW
jgi:hypothetical protein